MSKSTITLEQAISLVNGGGWRTIPERRHERGTGKTWPVSRAEVVDGVLQVLDASKVRRDIPVEGVTIETDGGDPVRELKFRSDGPCFVLKNDGAARRQEQLRFEEKDRQCHKFLAFQKEKIGGARVSDMAFVASGKLAITFDNGYVLEVSGEPDGEWGTDTLHVEGGGERFTSTNG